MMWLRIACLRAGYDVVPLIIPVAVLMSMVVAQIRFAVLLPVTLLTLGGIVGAELWFLGADGNRVFNLTGAVALVVVGLSPAYALEWWARSNWQRQTRLREFAQTDALTGLPNRRHFDTTLKHSLRIAARQAQPVALMILDIDHFKAYNDHYGHPAGDACLRAVGQYLAQVTQHPGSFAARIGGEEFVLVWLGADPQTVTQQAEQIRHGISQLGISSVPGLAALTASAGLCQIAAPHAPALADTLAATLLARADAALYAVKRSSRNRLALAPLSGAQATDSSSAPLPRQHKPVDESWTQWPRQNALNHQQQAAFHRYFDQQGFYPRILILTGLLAVIVTIILMPQALFELPEPVYRQGILTLLFGLMPVTLLALLGSLWAPLHRGSAALYIIAVYLILAAQMVQRVIHLSNGYDTVPLLMPVAVLLSLGVVNIRLKVLVPAAGLGLLGVIGAEILAFDLTTHRLLDLCTATLMVMVVIHTAGLLERWTRIGWLQEQRLTEQANTDPLTGLANRRHFNARLQHTLEVAAQKGQCVALMMLDLDHFKAYNDRYGHPQGDVCLRAVGQYLQQQIRRPDDFAGRVGGEEFTVVWVDADPQSSLIIQHADTVRDGISRLLLSATEPHTTMTASAGLALLQVPKADAIAYARAATELIARADAALYKAKNNNRNQLVMADTPA